MANPYMILNPNEYKNNFTDCPRINPLDAGIPLLDISDKDIMEIYYFRWLTYFSHIKPTPEGYVVTEFLPDVPWAGKYNTINCPLGHHLYEGRWIHNRTYLDDYCKWWFKGGEPRYYSTWFADAILAYVNVQGGTELVEELYEKLKENYFGWEEEKLRPNGLFYSIDGYDGMEYSISGSGFRPTLNSYMYGDLTALSNMAKMLSKDNDAKEFARRADALKERINTMMWDKDAKFYKTLSENNNFEMADVREQAGYIPWYFNIPSSEMTEAWKFLNDKNYFYGKFGPTTAERNHPDYMKEFSHQCLWNGPSWPFATSQTLVGMKNLINNYNQNIIKKGDYFDLLKTYTVSQHLQTPDGVVPFIDEDLHPDTGEWITRNLLLKEVPPREDRNRGEKYNHSSFCDLVITGIGGIDPTDNCLKINPLFEESQLEYFCLDAVPFQGKFITVLWDKTGKRYGKGSGLFVFADGHEVAKSEHLSIIHVDNI